jgi:deoxyguanosine kinase
MINYLCIEGIIGSGKTSLCIALERYFSSVKKTFLLKEKFEDNKLLELFYQQPQKYSVLTEYSFLIDRYHQLYTYFQHHQNYFTVSDFCFKKCLWFAETNLDVHQFEEYKKHYFQLEQDLQLPQYVVIYLDVKPEQAYQNILQRNRTIEKNINIAYLEKLYSIYSKNIPKLDVPVISINVKNYDNLLEECLNELKTMNYI